MKARAVVSLGLLAAATAGAQTTNKERLFGTGKPPVFKEEDLDRRFEKSKINRGLMQGSKDGGCQQLLGGLLAALASTAPLFHKRDENFYLDPGISNALQTQLSTQTFPATAYLAAMVRKVQIDGKLPIEWMNTATQLMQARTIDDMRLPIDLSRLKYLSDQVRPVDSFLYTVPQLMQLFNLEVLHATSVQAGAADMQFRDTYLDRDVAWSGLYLIDIGQEKPPPPKKGKLQPASAPVPDEGPATVAHLQWNRPDPNRNRLQIFGVKSNVPDILINARLAEPQYVPLTEQNRGKRMLVRGRLWDMNRTATSFELREAFLFDDPDTSRGAFLADPRAVAACPLAVNDLAGIAPRQPGGFGQH